MKYLVLLAEEEGDWENAAKKYIALRGEMDVAQRNFLRAVIPERNHVMRKIRRIGPVIKALAASKLVVQTVGKPAGMTA